MSKKMFQYLLHSVVPLLVLFFFVSCFSSKPEDCVRKVYSALFEKGWGTLASKLSGTPLRVLLACESEKSPRFSVFCLNRAGLPLRVKQYSLLFSRALYQDSRAEVVVRFLTQYYLGKRVLLRKNSWRLRLIEGEWKVVSFY